MMKKCFGALMGACIAIAVLGVCQAQAAPATQTDNTAQPAVVINKILKIQPSAFDLNRDTGIGVPTNALTAFTKDLKITDGATVTIGEYAIAVPEPNIAPTQSDQAFGTKDTGISGGFNYFALDSPPGTVVVT